MEIDIFIEYVKERGNEIYAKHAAGYFKTGKGEYGEGDVFLGIRMPELRKIAVEQEPFFTHNDWKILIKNPYHEIRLITLLMMVQRYQQKKTTDVERMAIVNTYLECMDGINNWDLVDLSSYKILGFYALHHKEEGRKIQIELSNSSYLWRERVAVVSTLTQIKNNDFEMTLNLCTKFLNHHHDLMHKACGWMLREVGKKQESVLIKYLDEHTKQMPRVMLRYSIERLSPDERQYYLKM